MLQPTKTLSLLTLVLLSGCIITEMIRARRSGAVHPIRRIVGLDAIPEAIGRATEMGRPVHYCIGLGNMLTEDSAETFAGLQMMGYVAKLCASYDTNLIVTIEDPLTLSVAEEIVRQACIAAGKPDAYRPDTVRFISQNQFAYAAGVMGIFRREGIATNIMIGPFYGDAMILAECGNLAGAIQVASTARMNQLPSFVMACDYVLLGEEMFAAAAYVSRDAARSGCVRGQDYAKVLIFLATLVGVVLRTLKVNTVVDLITKYGR